MNPASLWRRPTVAGANSHQHHLGCGEGHEGHAIRCGQRSSSAQRQGRASPRVTWLQSHTLPATCSQPRTRPAHISGDDVCCSVWAVTAITVPRSAEDEYPSSKGGPTSPTPPPDHLLASHERLRGVFLRELGPGHGGEGTPDTGLGPPTLASAVCTVPPPSTGHTSCVSATILGLDTPAACQPRIQGHLWQAAPLR